jgi:hypothetical protein
MRIVDSLVGSKTVPGTFLLRKNRLLTDEDVAKEDYTTPSQSFLTKIPLGFAENFPISRRFTKGQIALRGTNY